MEGKILHLYPQCMSLYGDWGNVAHLQRRLSVAGHSFTVETASFGEALSLEGVDFVYLGSGTERMTEAVMRDVRRYGAELRQAALDGLPMLFTGTAMELLGVSVTTAEDSTYEGLQIGEFTTVQFSRRIVGDVLGDCPLTGEKLVGYQNKSSHSSGITTPLLSSCILGQGNQREKGSEGFVYQNVIGTHLTAPVLVKNPQLVDWFVKTICERKGQPLTEPLPQDEHAFAAWQMSVDLLGKRVVEK